MKKYDKPSERFSKNNDSRQEMWNKKKIAAGSYKNLLRQNISIHLNDSSDSKKDVF